MFKFILFLELLISHFFPLTLSLHLLLYSISQMLSLSCQMLLLVFPNAQAHRSSYWSHCFLLQLCPPALLWLGWILGLTHSCCPRTCLHPFGCWMLFLSSPILGLFLPYPAFLFSSLELWESLFLVQVFSYSLCLEHDGSFCIISLMAPFLCFSLFSLNGTCPVSG